MKKNLFYYLFAVVCSMIVFTSCSDDDDKVVSPVSKTTFTDANGLHLTYSGSPMLGKKVTYSPNTSDATKATLTLAGESGLSTFTEHSTSAPTTEGAGVVPGEVTTTLNIENAVIDGDKVTFEGTNEQNGRIVKYKGEVTSQTMKLALNVTMPTNALADTSWSTFVDDGLGSIYYKWKADDFLFMDGTWDIESAIGLTLAFTQIDGKTVPQLLSGVLNKVTFLPDGNIQAEYKDELTDTEWKTSDLNIATYSVKEDKIYVYLNLSQIVANANRAAGGFEGILGNLIPAVLPMLSNGIPLSYSVNQADGKILVYLDTETLLPILGLLAPMFENEEFIDSIMKLLAEQAGEMGYLVGMLKPVLVALPNIIKTTETINIGLTLAPVK